MQIHFTVYARAEPQGSMKGFVLPGKDGRRARAILTSNNPNMKPYRQELTHAAMAEIRARNLVLKPDAQIPTPMAAKHIPVAVTFDFYLARPESIPKKRQELVVKPDVDKLVRSTTDALTGILYFDDAQIVDVTARKHYGSPERVEISAMILE